MSTHVSTRVQMSTDVDPIWTDVASRPCGPSPEPIWTMDDAGGLMYSLSRKAECEGELPLVRVWPCGVHTVNLCGGICVDI